MPASRPPDSFNLSRLRRAVKVRGFDWSGATPSEGYVTSLLDRTIVSLLAACDAEGNGPAARAIIKGTQKEEG